MFRSFRLITQLPITGLPLISECEPSQVPSYSCRFRKAKQTLTAQIVHLFRNGPMPLSVDNEVLETKSRLAHLALLNLNLRFMENWRSAQLASTGSTLDYESLMILMAIIVISAEKVLRTELEPDLQTLARQLPKSTVGKVNLSSIAAATEINRETVRRKVNSLQKAAWVIRDKEGVRIVPGVIPYDVIRNIIGAQLDALTRMVNQLTKMGVLTASSAPHSDARCGS